MKMGKFFSFKMLLEWLFTAIGVGIVAFVLGLIITFLNGVSGVLSGIVTAIVAFILLGMAVKMHSGKEDIISLVTTALIVLIVFGVVALFGLNIFAPVFDLTGFLGWAVAIVILLFGRVVGMRIANAIM